VAIVSLLRTVNNVPAQHFVQENAMHNRRPWFVLASALILFASACTAQDKKPASPPGEASLKFDDGKTLTIQYSRPSMRGRKIFGDLVPYNQVWRTGANAATSMKTDADLVIGDVPVPAGSYTLYSLPSEGGWKLIINKQTGQWGTEYNQGQDLARIDMKVEKHSSPVEEFTISLDKTGSNAAMLKLDWANTSASVDVNKK
jgi:hypothetical protein